jgi:ribosomal protein L9
MPRGISIPDHQPNQMPSVIQQMQMQEQQAKQKNYEAANAERKRQIAEDSANLLKLAVELKTEVDKTNKDVLSITVIRKADAIEKLARQVKEKMKLTVGAG